MAKEILLSSEIRNKIKSGVEKLNNAVRFTLGPKGRNVLISSDYGAPLIINDGASIVKSIELKDDFENMASKALALASIKTNDVVGDGTTSAVVVASSIITEGIDKISNGINPVELRKGLNYYLPIIIDYIKQNSKQIITDEDIYKVAYVSSGSSEVASLIKDAYKNTSKDTVITLEASQGIETSLVLVNGYSYDRGYLSSYMASTDKKEAELVNPYVLILNKKINNMNELVPFLEVAIKDNLPILIICDEIEQDVLNALVVNKLRGIVNVVVTKAPSFGNKKTQMLEDIAVLTNAKFVKDASFELPNLENNALGRSKKIIVSNTNTIIISDNKKEIDDRIKELKEELINTSSEYDKEKLEERIAKLVGGIAIIKVGALTEIEQKERQLLIEDAVCATKAAILSGVIPGGGKVFFEISEELKSDKYKEHIASKELLISALKKPFFQILENCGISFESIKDKLNNKMWFNATSETIEDYSQMNIIDPTSVAIAVISNAVSISSILLTTECGIVDINKNKEEVNEDNLL